MEVTGGSNRTLAEPTGKDNIVMQAVELTSHIAVIVASLVAILGVSAWRREFKGKRDMELAEDVLCLFYRAERAIEAIRFPIGYSFEGQVRPTEPNETPEQKEARDRAYGVIKRIQDHTEVFDQLYTLRFRFMARFGRDKAKPFDGMKHIISMISVSAQNLARLWADQIRRGGDLPQSTVEQIKKHEEVIWSMGEADQIESDVKRIAEEIEATCRPIIEGRPSWFARVFHKRP
jgi:hypothetical protein